MKATNILIIGAGISGLLCAHKLQNAGKSVRVLDKGRGVGGRMATRRMGRARFDHGAQYFTVRNGQLSSYVKTWLDAGVIKEWFRHLPEDSNPSGYSRYCGLYGMADVAKYLAKDLQVCIGAKVISLSKDSDLWLIRSEGDELFVAEELVITAPLPQAIELLITTEDQSVNRAIDTLGEVRYERGMATLAIVDGPSGLPDPGGVKVNNAPLTWIADNQKKGISPNVTAITIHADASFAQEHWESPDNLRGQIMLEAAAPFIQAKINEFSCHRWKFTKPINPLQESCYHNFELHLTLAGDSFGGARIEAAALSGLAAASSILKFSKNTNYCP